jgi:hypothetical protein
MHGCVEPVCRGFEAGGEVERDWIIRYLMRVSVEMEDNFTVQVTAAMFVMMR